MFTLPELPYRYDALRPVLSEATLRTHHAKHHRHYIEVTNALLARTGARTSSLEEVVEDAWRRSARKLFNNASQALNHAFYWECMAPGRTRPSPQLSQAMARAFGGLEDLRKRFVEEGLNHFGSGWIWLTIRQGKPQVMTTHDGDTAMRIPGLVPLLVCDLWEHAYYLDHRSDRAAYLAGWWDELVNWDFVSRQHEASVGMASAWTHPKSIASERLSPIPTPSAALSPS